MMQFRSVVLAGVLMILAANSGQTQDKKISAVSVNYDGLKQEILKQRGKVVIVDFWTTTCGPCRQAFPKFIKMHQDHESKGLVVISVALDRLDPEDNDGSAETIERIDKFLTEQQSPLRNLRLGDPKVDWNEKFGITAVPCYFVFDRQGKWVRVRGQDYPKGIDYAALQTIVLKMLDEK